MKYCQKSCLFNMTSKFASVGKHYLQKSTKFMGTICVDFYKHPAVAVCIDFLILSNRKQITFIK